MTSLVLPHSRTSAAAARRRFRSELARAGVPDGVLSDAVLVLSELVGNAMQHGRPLPDGAIRVEWSRHGDSVEIAITDGGGGTRPARRQVGPLSPSGRGLGIISELSSTWGVTQRADSSTVWALVGTLRPVSSPMSSPMSVR